MEKTFIRTKTFDVNCKIYNNGDIYWDDGCYKLFYDNGHEKESKGLFYNKTIWNYTFRNENGVVIKEYNERVDGKPISKNRIIEAIDFDGDKNWKFPFDRMTKYYGREFIDFMKNMWIACKDYQTEEDFCNINSIPIPFFNKVVKS